MHLLNSCKVFKTESDSGVWYIPSASKLQRYKACTSWTIKDYYPQMLKVVLVVLNSVSGWQ